MAKKKKEHGVVKPGCQVFCATMAKDREELGARVTEWLRANPDRTVTHREVLQSSDSAFHCVTIVVWYEEKQWD